MSEKDKVETPRKSSKTKIVVVGLLLAILTIVLLLRASIALIPLWIAAAIIIAIWLVYFRLAPANQFFTLVFEATGRFISRGGQVVRIIIQWVGYTQDDEGYIIPENTWCKDGRALTVIEVLDAKTGKLKIKKTEVKKRQEEVTREGVVETQDIYERVSSEEVIEGAKKYKESLHPLGGLRWIGWYPMNTIAFYDFAWTGVDQAGKVDPHPKESLGLLVLTDDNYYFPPRPLETRPPENLPVLIPMASTIRIANPRKAIFAAEKFLEITDQAIESVKRDFNAAHDYEELISERDIGDQILMMAEYRGITGELFTRYGIELRKLRALDVIVAEAKDVKNDLQRATLRTFEATQTAKATLITAMATSQRRAKETMGSIVQMMAETTGDDPKDIQAKIKKSPRLRSQLQKFIQELTVRQVSIAGKSFVDIRVEGAEGIEKSLLNFIAAYQRIPSKVGSEKEVDGEDKPGAEEDMGAEISEEPSGRRHTSRIKKGRQ